MFIYSIGDIITGTILALLLSILIGTWFFKTIKAAVCSHKRTYENGLSLDEICRDCGKNLGFVGRDK